MSFLTILILEVALQYRHFRPTGKAILTMALPDFTRKAILQLENTRLLGVRPEAEPILSPETFLGTPQNVNSLEVTGDGPSAGVTPRRTVSLSGLPGRTGIETVHKLLQGFKLVNEKGQPAVQVAVL